MSLDPQTEKLLEMIEQQNDIGGRFENVHRCGLDGGNGAFSLIVEAEDKQRMNGKVALKFLHPFERNDYRRRCFEREPEILARAVGQKDIIQLIAPRAEFSVVLQPVGFPIPFAYYALELASSDLGSAIESGGMSAGGILQRFRVMCRAVQRVHSLGIAHRDIKPANFIVMPDGTIKLSDFGTARSVADGAGGLIRDYAGFPPGDLGYTAPEILASLHDDDPRFGLDADIFALGASLFEMFSGVPLGVQLFDQTFQQDLLQAMAQVRRGDRKRIYDQFVGGIANSVPLPSIAAFSPNVPLCIVPVVDELYRSMASLDYRVRAQDFDLVFLRISRALLILDNEKKIQQWRQRRQREHAAAVERQQMRAGCLPKKADGNDSCI
jgi:serine/threonine protein kinase